MTTLRKSKKGTRTESLIFKKVSDIKASWSADEKAHRAEIGMERRLELERLLFGDEWLRDSKTCGK